MSPDRKTILAITAGVIGYAITITIAIGLAAAGFFGLIADTIP